MNPITELRIEMDDETHVREALPAASLSILRGAGADLSRLFQLAAVHRTLWALEDSARSRKALAEAISKVKRAIDVENGRRHALIDDFDESYAFAAPSGQPCLVSETPGELGDRLLILALKIRKAREHADDTTLREDLRRHCGLALARLTSWRDHLVHCLECETKDLSQGKVLLPPRREFKMYNQPLLNPVTRQELEDAGTDPMDADSRVAFQNVCAARPGRRINS